MRRSAPTDADWPKAKESVSELLHTQKTACEETSAEDTVIDPLRH